MKRYTQMLNGRVAMTRLASTAGRWGSPPDDAVQPHSAVTPQKGGTGPVPVDSHSGASVVIKNPEDLRETRDRLARAELSEQLPDKRSLHVLSGVRMTVPYTLKVITSDDNSDGVLQSLIEEAFTLCDSVLNNYNPESEVSAVNNLGVGQSAKMSAVLSHVLQAALHVNHATAGAYDPCSTRAVKWLTDALQRGESGVNHEGAESIFEASHVVQGFEFDFPNHQIKKLLSGACLDLCGISKGYTVDRVVETLLEAGYNDVLFEWGGDARGSGRNVMGKPWAVAVRRPPQLEDLRKPTPADPPLIQVLLLDNEAIATSGDYESLVEGVEPPVSNTYDPSWERLIQPNEHEVAQVTVKNGSCMIADALATAALVKRDLVRIRLMMDNWRYTRYAVTDYVAYVREGERVARMHEIARENHEMRQKRIEGSLPARVVVIGGGLAGCSAAIEAASCGASVILMEKEGRVGGNSAKATSGINGWGTRAQGERDIADGGKFFERDTHLSGRGGTTHPGLVSVLSEKSGEAINWLSKTLNVPLTVVSQLGGHSRPRTHRTPDKPDGTPVPVGFTIMRAMETHIKEELPGKITLMTNTCVTELVMRDKRIVGVKYASNDNNTKESGELPADAVIMTTGGFANDRTDTSLLRRFAPHLSHTPTTNGAFATGDGVKLGEAVGATLMDMDKVQLHPTGLIDPKKPANPTKFLGPEALRGSGGILINSQGKRFINELDLRSVVAKAINSQGDVYPESDGAHFAYCVMNAEASKLFGVHSLGFYKDKLGLFTQVPDLQALAAHTGAPLDALQATLSQYEQTSTSKRRCPVTGKTVFPCVVGTEGPFVVACVTPSIHYTMGGLAISPSGEVQAKVTKSDIVEENEALHGLFAAGEASAGVHGANRLGGNSLLECVVFGRIAGDRAATILQRHHKALSFNDWCTVLLREVRVGGSFGSGARILVFNFPGTLQVSGLELGQFVAIRGEWDGRQLVGYYSPITLPDQPGYIGLLCRMDKGTLSDWISALKPGDSVEMKGFGGLSIERCAERKAVIYRGAQIRSIGMVAGGTGVAPMLQILRAVIQQPYLHAMESIRLLYAAETEPELTYDEALKEFEGMSEEKFKCHFVVNNPPPGWIGGVGYIDANALTVHLQPPSEDHLVVLCGPQMMQRVVKAHLLRIGHDPSRVKTVDEMGGGEVPQ